MKFWTWAHRLTAAGFLALIVSGLYGWFPWVQGSPTAALWLGAVPFLDPLAALEVSIASRGVPMVILPAVGLTLLVSILLGRVFCGWLCPLGLITELNAAWSIAVRRTLSRSGLRLAVFHVPKETKYWLLALLVGLSLFSGVPVFTAVSPINLVVLGLYGAPLAGALVVGSILALEHFSPRAFCRGLCPLGAFYSLVGRLGLLRIHVRDEAEKMACQRCTLRCPMGIRIMEEHVLAGRLTVADPECIRCGVCTDACPGSVLRLGFRRQPHTGPTRCSVRPSLPPRQA